MTHVQGTVGVGRPVVQREDRPWVVEAQFQVDASLGPERLQLWFPLHRIGAHAEARLQQVERVLVGGTSFGVGVARLLAHGWAAADGIIRPRWPSWVPLLPWASPGLLKVRPPECLADWSPQGEPSVCRCGYCPLHDCQQVVRVSGCR